MTFDLSAAHYRHCAKCGHDSGYHGASFCTRKTYEGSIYAGPSRLCDCTSYVPELGFALPSKKPAHLPATSTEQRESPE